jgi:hypothetical protein
MTELPNSSYRDIIVKDNDLLVATYGRGIYVLDDISALRQVTPVIADRRRASLQAGQRRAYASQPEREHTVSARDSARAQSLPGVIVDYTLTHASARRGHARRARPVGSGH